MNDRLTQRIFRVVSEEADSLGFRTYVVGGYVRDLLLGRSSHDIDIMTVGSGIELAERVSKRIGRTGLRYSETLARQ